MTEEVAYHEICGYTMSLGDPAFIHQHVVDAFAAQTANAETKPIKLTFALIGLYLHLEQHFNGRDVQRAHVFLARAKRSWPTFTLPERLGSVTAHVVLARPVGPERRAAIDLWCAAVWEAFCAADVNTARVVRGICEELPHLRRD